MKNYNPITLEHVVRALIHIPIGLTIFAALCLPLIYAGSNDRIFLPVFWASCAIGIAAAAIFAWYFKLYEWNEDKHLGDKAFMDIVGALIGLALGIWWLFFELLL